VAAVAADNDEIAEEALNLIDVQYQELPYVTDPVKGDRTRRAGAA
jgi:CO/xanthine dehydrogenase Mo-binding subunit